MTDNKIALLCGFIVVFSFCGCRSIKTESQKKELTDTELLDSAAVSWSQGVNVKELIHSDLSLDEITDFDFTLFYPPDSNGVQSVRAKGSARKEKKVQQAQELVRNREDTTTASIHSGSAMTITKNRETHDISDKNFKFCGLKCYLSVGCLLLLILFIIKYKKWLH